MHTNVAHRVRRLSQTPRTFENWPTVLADMARGQHGPRTLTFITRDGQRISCPNQAGARVPVYEIFAEDCYRLEEFFGSALQQPLRVLDIGAHVGAFACRLAALAPQAVIHCFEPSAVTADYLRRNVADNGFADRVHVGQAALAGRAGRAVLADNGGGSALNGLTVGGKGASVEADTFDAVVARVGPVDVVKIDCEGGEYDAILSSSPSSWTSVHHVVLEYHDQAGYDWPQLRGWLADTGLHVVREQPQTARQGTAWLVREVPA